MDAAPNYSVEDEVNDDGTVEAVASVDYCPVAQIYEDESLYENMKSGNVAISSYLHTDNVCRCPHPDLGLHHARLVQP